MASRRQGKERRAVFGDSSDMTLQEASDIIYGDPAMLDEMERQRVKRRAFNPKELTIDPAIQVRLKQDPARVEELKQVLLNGGSFKDPIRVFRDKQGRLWLAAGFRRTEATVQALAEAPDPSKIAPLMGDEIPGEREDAVEDAESDNLKHGEPLSAEEKRGIFKRRMARGHEWVNWSNNQIAAELAVNEITIRRWRSSLSSTNVEVRETEGKKGPEKRVGTDGREYRVDRLQKAAQKRAKKQAKETPSEPVRNLDESEPVGQWQDRPAQPRGLYRQAASPSVRPRAADDSVPTEQDNQQWIISQYRQLAGLVEERGRSGEARMTRSIVASLVQAWGQKSEPSTPS
jgi:hypothetical protein